MYVCASYYYVYMCMCMCLCWGDGLANADGCVGLDDLRVLFPSSWVQDVSSEDVCLSVAVCWASSSVAGGWMVIIQVVDGG